MEDPYHILGVSNDCSFETLKRAYYRKAKDCHPDHHAGHPAKAEAFKQLVEAFNCLSDPLARAAYDARQGVTDWSRPFTSMDHLQQEAAILDSRADDILEELIVGNTIPRNTTLQTLMLDMERTEQFCLFREAKSLFCGGQTLAAQGRFEHYLVRAPLNILAHYYLGRCHVRAGRYRKAVQEYGQAIRIGSRRRPPLHVPRIRRERQRIQETKLGWWGRALARYGSGAVPAESLPPDEEVRREVTRAMQHLIQERARNARKALRSGQPLI